jgi:tetratricopeptide (TPR) repeat protein
VQETAAGAAASDPATALSSYDAALSINPSHVPALLGAADALFDQGDAPTAIARAESATQLLPAQPEGWGNLAVYRLAAGDQAGAEAAYAQFITNLAARHPQERMATLRDVLVKLGELLEGSPENSAGVAPLLAQTAAFLDGMNTDGGARTYQYASLYTAVGKLALEAGAPADAERWLRQSLAIDPLQPEAHVDLVVAVIAQGRDASVAIAAAISMVNDPAWLLTSSYDLNALLDLMDAEAQAVAGDDAAVAPLRQAIAAARPS